MPTPRSEAIKNALDGSSNIRPILNDNERENRIDHYAVLSQVMQVGIDAYFDTPAAQTNTSQTHSLEELEATLRTEIHQSIIVVLESDAYAAHYQSLRTSQHQRSEAGNRWPDVSLNISAGIGTFLAVVSEVFHILQSRLGVEAASHPGNWRIVDRIAKLNMHAFAAFQETYLRKSKFENWSALIEQLEVGREGQIQFQAGYPGNAPIRTNIINKEGELKKTDYILDGSLPLGKLRNIAGYDSAIGCPVTFRPDTVSKLWGAYATEAYRIATTPATATTGDTVASPQ